MGSQDLLDNILNLRDKLSSRRVGMSLILACGMSAFSATASDSFVTFESGQVRPMAMSEDGRHLYVVDTPDNRIEIFAITDSGLTNTGSVSVGMEPVALAVRGHQVWVVNHLSDSVSVVDVSKQVPYVTQTLLVGDEPRDIVFAGSSQQRAFITTAHRGQATAEGTFDPFSRDGRADVWVFDVHTVETGDIEPLTVINMMGDTPRALAVSENGQRVYAAVFMSGNQTTVLSHFTVLQSDKSLPLPHANMPEDGSGVIGPPTGLIVKKFGDRWLDSSGQDWTDSVRVSLPDYDVFEIDAEASIPFEVARISGVGTTLLNMVVHPISGKLYVSNLEANNHIRFEGPGGGGSTVRGQSVLSRITVIDGTDIQPVHLNSHIDYSTALGSAEERRHSLAFPMEMVISSDGETMYTAAFGSSKIGMFSIAELDSDSITPDVNNQIEVTGGGPSGLVLDEARNRLYVLTRFDNSVVVVDLSTKQQMQSVAMYNPEPAEVIEGRPFLYDATYTSSRGDSACASCHMFADTDHLSWDLGNPDALVEENPNQFAVKSVPPGVDTRFHPLKGPLTTQSLRGLKGQGPQHWRGDRPGQDGSGDPIEEVAFKQFNGAFVGLVGRETTLTDSEMESFTKFAMALTYPPNPIRDLDNQLTASQQRGKDFFFNQHHDFLGRTCSACHTINPAQGKFGTSGESVFRPLAPPVGTAMKVPHFRNLYTKNGFFRDSSEVAIEDIETTEQIRGFGFRSDGSKGDLMSFLRGPFFTFPNGDDERRDVVEFLMAMDSNLLPIVGQQVTLGSDLGRNTELDRIALFIDRALETSGRPECDLIAKGRVSNKSRGWVMQSNRSFRSDRASESDIILDNLVRLSNEPTQSLTFTCVPPGSGVRMGIDRDEDGVLDGDEVGA